MGNSCSSGQGHKDKDNASQKSEESPSYQITSKPLELNFTHAVPDTGARSGVILEPYSAGGQAPSPAPLLVTQQSFTERKTGLSKVLKGLASSSISDSMSLSSPVAIGSPRDFDAVPSDPGGPQWVLSMSGPLQRLLHGKVATLQPVKSRKIVIYVCAADSQDCCSEKGYLHNVVYPLLRNSCLSRGFELHIVDLHWRSALEKQQDHEFPTLCLGELTRQSEHAYVIPVLFLNSSLGTPLLPLTIESSDFKSALDKAQDSTSKELLSKWYQLDSGAQPPCYRLQPVGSHIPGFKESCPGEREKALEQWRDEIEKTLAVLVDVFPKELKDTYLTTVVEQEVHNTVLMSQELARRCLWINRAPLTQPVNPDAELLRRLSCLTKDLKAQLAEKHILRSAPRSKDEADMEAYLTQVTSHLQSHLSTIINTIIQEHCTRDHVKPSQGIKQRLFEELEQHSRLYQEIAQNCVNRENILGEIKSYILGDSTHPFILYGPPGSGKTTVISRTAQCCQQWLPESHIIIRFAGLTTQSRSILHLFGSITEQCNVLVNGSESNCIHEMKAYSEVFNAAITNAQRPLIIIIDNLGELYGNDTTWLPRTLPENVKIIITTTHSENSTANLTNQLNNNSVFEALRGQLEEKCFVKLLELASEESKNILLAGVSQYSHSVNPTVQDCIVNAVRDCTLPLYAKLVAWQTCLSPYSMPMNELNNDIVTEYGILAPVVHQFEALLHRLEDSLGAAKVSMALAIVAESRGGMTDSEMIDLLSGCEDFHSQETYLSWAPALLFWSRLYSQLVPFMTYRQARISFNHNLLTSIVKRRYRDALGEAHRAVYNYYMGENEIFEGIKSRTVSHDNRFSTDSFNARKMSELPYHYFYLYNFEAFTTSEFLTDLQWIFDKLGSSDCCELIDDINLFSSEDFIIPEHILILKEFLVKNFSALNYDHRQLFSLLKVYLDNKLSENGEDVVSNVIMSTKNEGQTQISARSNNAKHSSNNNHTTMKITISTTTISSNVNTFSNGIIQEWYELAQKPSVLSLIPLNVRLSKLKTKKNEEGRRIFDMVERLSTDGPYVATLSTEREEICVWDVERCCRVRTLTNITHPITLCSIDATHCIVLCRRELQVFDLDLGRALVKLKGVMNQKMPYFGLHDRNHVVCLSRNRMYVNLMNLDSGDCVTTFKAGEDRFLNSLLVSGDGRILVCGDETQKPFPLLVWHLTSRKLLYDMRIPHHDFVTSLAAITYEGNYVCVVCYEITEPSPNFIVVYDLQSGTLFKKWKPSCDTVSLEISSKDGCVVSGLEDARILVWDLVTGNCRFTLTGHTAPVTSLRLDPNGGVLLSFDSQCRDTSVRLWDLNKGVLLAVYTPPEKITSCDLIFSGKYVMLAMENYPDLVTLKLCGGDLIEEEVEQNGDEEIKFYGVPENEGKVFNLKDSSNTA